MCVGIGSRTSHKLGKHSITGVTTIAIFSIFFLSWVVLVRAHASVHMPLRNFVETEVGRSTLNVGSTIPHHPDGEKKKGESELKAGIHLTLLPDWACDVSSYCELLLP